MCFILYLLLTGWILAWLGAREPPPSIPVSFARAPLAAKLAFTIFVLIIHSLYVHGLMSLAFIIVLAQPFLGPVLLWAMHRYGSEIFPMPILLLIAMAMTVLYTAVWCPPFNVGVRHRAPRLPPLQ